MAHSQKENYSSCFGVILILFFFVFLQSQSLAQTQDDLFRMGKEEFERKNFSKALTYFLSVYKTSSQTKGLNEALGETYIALERAFDAIPYLTNALRESPENASLYFNLSLCYELTFQERESIVALKEGLKLDSANTGALIRLANLEMRVGNHQESRHALETLIQRLKQTAKVKPDSAEVFLNLGMGYLLFGEWEEVEHALSVLERLGSPLVSELKSFIDSQLKQTGPEVKEIKLMIRKKPKDAELYRKLGGVLLYTKQYEQAEDAFKKAVELDSLNAASYRSLAYLYLRTKRYRDAEQMFEQSTRLTPSDSPEILGLLAHLGHTRLNISKIKEALQAFQYALTLAENMNPKDVGKFTTELAYIYFGIAVGRYNNEQINEVKWVANPFSFRIESLENRTFSIFPPHLRRFEPILASLSDALRLKNDFAEAYAFKGVVQLHLGDNAAAANAYREAIKIKPDFAEAYAGLGACISRMGNDDAAIALILNAIAQKKDYADAYALLAKLYERRNRIKEAISTYEKLLEFEPNNEKAHFDVGLLYGKVGNSQMLLKHYYILQKLKSPLAERLYRAKN
ncbi:MAG: tetratricopeptide repeat protein [Chloroherpetonaceae bacterium]|nr:tetratricopeptide repeat protein [Chloroherpetonaceae bacterium]